jgi:tetratricopeptide (TPR) repeat protein
MCVKKIAALLAIVLALGLTASCDSSRAERHYKRGVRNMLKGRSDKAVEEFSKAIHYNPQYSQAFFQLASVYESTGSLEKARDVYQELMRVDPTMSAEAECRLAKVYSRLGRWEEAVACFNRVIDKNPRNADAYYGLATIYRQLNEKERALRAYQQAVECNEQLFEAHYALAVMYYTDGKFSHARTHAERAAERFPSARKLLALIEEDLPRPTGRM